MKKWHDDEFQCSLTGHQGQWWFILDIACDAILFQSVNCVNFLQDGWPNDTEDLNEFIVWPLSAVVSALKVVVTQPWGSEEAPGGDMQNRPIEMFHVSGWLISLNQLWLKKREIILVTQFNCFCFLFPNLCIKWWWWSRMAVWCWNKADFTFADGLSSAQLFQSEADFRRDGWCVSAAILIINPPSKKLGGRSQRHLSLWLAGWDLIKR